LPAPANRISQVKALDAITEVAHKVLPAEFPVRGNLEPKFLLLRQNTQNFLIFYLA
jgi:hypothetical protein